MLGLGLGLNCERVGVQWCATSNFVSTYREAIVRRKIGVFPIFEKFNKNL